MSISSRDCWKFDIGECRFPTLDEIATSYIRYYLSKLQCVFEYKNLPNTIPQRDFELILQRGGSATIAKVDDKLYAFRSGLGGTPNPYYMPTISIIANPALNLSKTYTIDKDCVVMYNDSTLQGVLPLLNKYCYLLAECDISLKFASINSRINTIITANTDRTKVDAENWLENIIKGDRIGVISDKSLNDGLKVFNAMSQSRSIIDLLELTQYIKSSLLTELGMKSNYSMKREAISTGESAMNVDAIIPFIEDMFNNRKIGVDKINKMFGTNIEVDYSSIWKKNDEELDLEVELEKAQVENLKDTSNDNDEKEKEEEKEDEDSNSKQNV